MESYEGKLQELRMRLQKEKDSKKKLKRKLKMKIAENSVKMKTKLKLQKKMVRKLKKVILDYGAIDCNIDNVDDEDISSNNEMIGNVSSEVPATSGKVLNHQPIGVVTGAEMQNEIDANYVQFFHSYAMSCAKKPNKVYRCSNCSYWTNKRYNLNKHESSSHGEKPARDMECHICKKLFDYDGLRNHLNHFATGKFEAKNEHSKFTPQQHKIELEKLKQNKNN